MQGKPVFDGNILKNERYSLKHKGKQIAVCTWGDNEGEILANIAFAENASVDAVIMACRTKGKPLKAIINWNDEAVFKKSIKRQRNEFNSDGDFQRVLQDKALKDAKYLIYLLEKLL